MNSDDCLKKAWACLLQGDTNGRDRWCNLAENLMKGADRHQPGGNIIEGEFIEVKSVIALPDRSKENLN